MDEITARHRALIRSLQRRLGREESGTIDTELLLELDETLAVATKFFTRLFQPDSGTARNKIPAAPTPPARRAGSGISSPTE